MDQEERRYLFKNLPFSNIFIDKPKIKKLSNVKLLQELPFYDEYNTVKKSVAFSGYARSYKVKIINYKDSLAQLQESK